MAILKVIGAVQVGGDVWRLQLQADDDTVFGTLAQVQDDTGPVLGGTLDIGSHPIDSGSQQIFRYENGKLFILNVEYNSAGSVTNTSANKAVVPGSRVGRTWSVFSSTDWQSDEDWGGFQIAPEIETDLSLRTLPIIGSGVIPEMVLANGGKMRVTCQGNLTKGKSAYPQVAFQLDIGGERMKAWDSGATTYAGGVVAGADGYVLREDTIGHGFMYAMGADPIVKLDLTLEVLGENAYAGINPAHASNPTHLTHIGTTGGNCHITGYAEISEASVPGQRNGHDARGSDYPDPHWQDPGNLSSSWGGGDGNSDRGTWYPGEAYNKGEIVYNRGRYWRCRADYDGFAGSLLYEPGNSYGSSWLFWKPMQVKLRISHYTYIDWRAEQEVVFRVGGNVQDDTTEPAIWDAGHGDYERGDTVLHVSNRYLNIQRHTANGGPSNAPGSEVGDRFWAGLNAPYGDGLQIHTAQCWLEGLTRGMEPLI